MPSGSHFMHLCYIECAREFWKNPFLFSENVSRYELQKNMRDSETMIGECINETIRKLLPVRYILKELLNEPDEEIEEDEHAELAFEYDLIDSNNIENLEDNPAFKDHIGNILVSIIMENIEKIFSSSICKKHFRCHRKMTLKSYLNED